MHGKSGQFVTISAEVTGKGGGLVRESYPKMAEPFRVIIKAAQIIVIYK